MKHTKREPAGRGGFTLVELLVVISIIAVLMSLTAAAVFKVYSVARDTQTRTEIGNMTDKIATFKQHYNVDYIPSRIRLNENMFYQQAQQRGTLDYESYRFLHAWRPDMKFNITGSTAPVAAAQRIDWDGDGTRGNSDVILEGDQCLVFFLGGIPDRTTGIGTGFSSNDTQNPAIHTTTPSVKPNAPFYEFRPDRLVSVHPSTPRFKSYADPYSDLSDASKIRVYAYFSSYAATDDYKDTDCQTIRATPRKVSLNPLHYENRSSFQIICAGQKRNYDTGIWGPTGK